MKKPFVFPEKNFEYVVFYSFFMAYLQNGRENVSEAVSGRAASPRRLSAIARLFRFRIRFCKNRLFFQRKKLSMLFFIVFFMAYL